MRVCACIGTLTIDIELITVVVSSSNSDVNILDSHYKS